MKLKASLAVCGLVAFSLDAADIGQIIVRQQWPWSTDVKVEYTLSNVTEPVDVKVRVFNGEEEADEAKVAVALSGERYDLRKGDTYTLTIDPTGLFDTSSRALSDFRVTLSAVKSEEMTEVLYKIINLESPYGVADVTRGRLLNGEMGDVVTDYSTLGDGWSTPLEDVLIWTGVTNDVKYKTTHMVLRKIPAKNQHFQFLQGRTVTTESGATTEAGIDVSFTNDFYITVFEVTQSQYLKVRSHADGKFWHTNELYAAMRPAEKTYFTAGMRGKSLTSADLGNKWPEGDHTDVDDNSFMKILQTRTGLVLDLPTEAMWEFACRAQSTAEMYTGQNYTFARIKAIARLKGVNRPNSESTADRNSDLSDGPAIVGTYLPNAWGLYDMIGNLDERVLDIYTETYICPDSLTLVDPRGAPNTTTDNPVRNTKRVIKGLAYTVPPGNAEYYGYRKGLHNYDPKKTTGFRVCLYPDFTLSKGEE